MLHCLSEGVTIYSQTRPLNNNKGAGVPYLLPNIFCNMSVPSIAEKIKAKAKKSAERRGGE